MNMKKIYSLVLVFFVLVLTACGTDTKENPPKPDGPYSFFNATTPLKITAPKEVNGTVTENIYEIKVQLLEFGLAKSGESIQMKPFDVKYGFVTNAIETTDANGFATFIYNAPEKYNNVRGQDITIEAIYIDPESESGAATNRRPSQPDILLTQDFVLQFR